MSLTWPATSHGSDEAAYETVVRDAVANDDYEMTFAPVTSTAGGHTGTFYVSALPIRIDGFFPGMGARLLQQCADMLGCALMTPKLLDIAYLQAATRIEPIQSGNTQALLDACNPANGAAMESLHCFRVMAKANDAALQASGYKKGTLASSLGKPFVLVKGLSAGVGANYGWEGTKLILEPCVLPPAEQVLPDGTPHPFGVIQGVGTKHGVNQDDYASTGLLWHRYCLVDNKVMDAFDVVTSAELAPLVSHQGALPYFRQPGVEVYACTMPGGPPKMASSATPPGRCPMPGPPTVVSGGAGGGSMGLIAGLAGVGAAGGLAWVTRDHWLPPLRRLWRRL